MTAQSVSHLHEWRHADYVVAREHIYRQIGDLSGEHVIGRQVLVAIYIRPEKTFRGVYLTTKFREQDISQGKAVMILKLGPGAFKGTDSYLEEMWGSVDNVPKVGDWMLMRPQDGVGMSMMCDGAQEVMVEQDDGPPVKAYDWMGWPCRVVQDDQFLMKMSEPHKGV